MAAAAVPWVNGSTVKSAIRPTAAPPATTSCDLPCAGHVQQVQGQVQVQRGNNLITLKPGDQINMNDSYHYRAQLAHGS